MTCSYLWHKPRWMPSSNKHPQWLQWRPKDAQPDDDAGKRSNKYFTGVGLRIYSGVLWRNALHCWPQRSLFDCTAQRWVDCATKEKQHRSRELKTNLATPAIDLQLIIKDQALDPRISCIVVSVYSEPLSEQCDNANLVRTASHNPTVFYFISLKCFSHERWTEHWLYFEMPQASVVMWLFTCYLWWTSVMFLLHVYFTNYFLACGVRLQHYLKWYILYWYLSMVHVILHMMHVYTNDYNACYLVVGFNVTYNCMEWYLN